MNDNPEGTPNPLNPAADAQGGAEAAGTAGVSGVVQPAAFAEPAATGPRPVSASAPETAQTQPAASEPAIDPLMEVTEEIVTSSVEPVPTPVSVPEPTNYVAKDSIVKSGSSKKPLIIGAIVLLIIAIICGAAAIALTMVKGKDTSDRVSKAIEKLLDGDAPKTIAANGVISVSSEDDLAVSYNMDFDGIFDMASMTNKVSARVEGGTADGPQVTINVDELRDDEGDIFFKISGLKSIMSQFASSGEQEVTSSLSLLSMYTGLFEAVDNQWILVSEDMADELGGLGIFNNSSACMINAVRTLPEYTKNLASAYKNNPFITYSTTNLGIAKKKNELYRIEFDADKLTAFINSLSNNGFINELNACAGDVATNTKVTTDMVEDLLAKVPTIYVEVDDNYTFTRVYFEVGTMINADLALSYPAKLELETPDSYVDISTLMSNAMVDFLDGGDAVVIEEGELKSGN